MNIYIIGNLDCKDDIKRFREAMANDAIGPVSVSTWPEFDDDASALTEADVISEDIYRIRTSSLIIALRDSDGSLDFLTRYRIEMAKAAGVPVIVLDI